MSYHVCPPPPAPAASARTPLEVAEIFRRFGEAYARTHPLTPAQLRAMNDIQDCRTASLGGHLHVCDTCDYRRPSYNSCIFTKY